MQVAHRSHVIADDRCGGAAARGARREARLHRARDRGHRHRRRWWSSRPRALRVIPTARAARLTMDREGIRRLAAETARPQDLALPFASDREEYWEARSRCRLPLCGQADHELLRQGPERGRATARAPSAPGSYAQEQRARRGRQGHRRGLRRVRLRDHAAHGAPRGGHLLLRAHWAPSGVGRLPRELAAAADVRARVSPRQSASRARSPTSSAGAVCSAWSCS